MTVQSRDIEFAWGPSSGGRLGELGSLEFAIVAGEGGKGTLWIADLKIEDEGPTRGSDALTRSSALPGFEPSAALAGTGWKPQPEDQRPWIAIDSIQPRTVGGLIIDWLEQAPVNGFRIRGSNGGGAGIPCTPPPAAGGKRSYVYLPGVKTRFLRLEVGGPTAGASLRLQSFEFSRSIHAFWHNVADGEARGWHPRWLHNEQSRVDADRHGQWHPLRSAECGRDVRGRSGVVLARTHALDQGPVSSPGRMSSPRQELLDDWMPVPAVIWESRRMAAADSGRGDARRRNPRALSIRESGR